MVLAGVFVWLEVFVLIVSDGDIESFPRTNPKGFPSKTTYIPKEMQDLRYYQQKG